MKYLKKIEIKNLWGKYDIEWNLNEDINILAGINGSGKTTILDLIAGTLYGYFDKSREGIADSVKITFDNGKFISYKKIKGTIKNLVQKSKEDIIIKDYISQLKKNEGRDFSKIHAIEGAVFSFKNIKMTKEELHKKLGIDVISTFDHELKNYVAIRKLTEESVTTELDLQIYLLQKQYLDYQINIGKKAMEALAEKKDNNLHKKINFKKTLFLDTLDNLFKATEKKVNRDKNELFFIAGKQNISPYLLSSGEKQLIIILLTALIQEEKNYVLFMDEPEISLHTDWQEKLIEIVKKLNENVQIILATHSPSIVLDGWNDKIFEIPEIIVKARK